MIDINAYLGPFAFRQLRHNTAEGLLRLMDRARVGRALVSNAAGITYRNSQAANEELAGWTKPHRDRLIPCAVLNPAYAEAVRDLKVCREEFGMRAVRIYPHWHKYSVSDGRCVDFVHAAAALKMPVSVPFRVEDRRQQSWLVDVADMTQSEAIALVRAAPEAHFIFGNGAGFAGSELGRAGNGMPANYSVEISLLTAVMGNEFGQLVENLGAGRILFGSGMPFHYPEGALLKMEMLEAPAAAKAMIAEGNAARLLGL